jgi:hypothetical protein
MPRRVDAVRVPARRVRGEGDELPPLVARALRRTEVDAHDHVDLECTPKRGASVCMTLSSHCSCHANPAYSIGVKAGIARRWLLPRIGSEGILTG